MTLNPRLISSAAAIAIVCMVTTAAYFYKTRNSEINEVMIFCKLQYNAHNYFDKLISFIEMAKRSVNVCMPGIHNPAIQGRLVELIKKKNIKIRILIDRSGYKESTEVFMKELVDAGAEIRCKTHETCKMRHKFCLVDDRVLMTGTLNWGNDLSLDNWNYVYITSKNQLVKPVKNEFYQMWNNSMDLWKALEMHPILFSNNNYIDVEEGTETTFVIDKSIINKNTEECSEKTATESSKEIPLHATTSITEMCVTCSLI